MKRTFYLQLAENAVDNISFGGNGYPIQEIELRIHQNHLGYEQLYLCC